MLRAPLLASLAGLLLVPLAAGGIESEPEALARGRATITESDLRAHVEALVAPHTEGRDSPSAGLARAARYVAERFSAAGLGCAPDAQRAPEAGSVPSAGSAVGASGPQGCSYLREFTLTRPEPDATQCQLELEAPERASFALGVDFVPAHGADGQAEGELLFAGYGIRDKGEGWDDLGTSSLRGKVVVILEGEPEHPRRFEGPELSAAASLWRKLADLAELEAEGVIVVRAPLLDADGAPLPGLAFRHTWAEFLGLQHDTPPREPPPTLEVTRAAASRLLGEDVEALAAALDGRSRNRKREGPERRVRLRAATQERELSIDNVVGWIAGSDPALASEVVVVGAHYDHLGVDARGRVALGADDNASGTAVLLELGEALALAQPRRTVCLVAFAAEEDGLLGSQAFVARPPVPTSAMAAMLNLDMVGRGDAREVAVIGTKQNPGLEKLLKRAQKLSKTGVTKLVTRGGEELFERSDHYSFHQKGVPILFLFEGLPISRNPDYHTWRDVPERLDFDKLLATALLTYNAAWLLADEDDRPPPPRE